MTRINGSTAREVFKKTDGKCFYCGCVLPADTEYLDEQGKVFMSSRNWHVDHGTPVSRGGSNKMDNLFPSCVACNQEKSDQTVEEFTGMVPA